MSPDPAIFSQVGTPDTSMQASPLPHPASQSSAIVVHAPVEVTHACPEAQSIARHGLVLSTSASWTCQSEAGAGVGGGGEGGWGDAPPRPGAAVDAAVDDEERDDRAAVHEDHLRVAAGVGAV